MMSVAGAGPGAHLRVASPAPARAKGISLGDMRMSLKRVLSAPEPARYAGLQADQAPAAEELPAADDLEGMLRWLARTQNVDGSWEGDVETTAAALLAFMRAGHTTSEGHYRQQVRRAVGWLKTAPAAGFAAFARAVALAELAAATRSETHREAARAALEELASPRTPLETAALSRAKSPAASPPGPGGIRDLDDLRLAGICGRRMSVPGSLLREKRAPLARAWAAAIARAS
jgi:hypothetical protein